MERRTERRTHDRGRWSETQYLGDQIDGLWTVYRKDGSKDWERQYVQGVQNGYQRTWSPSGQLLEEQWFRDGQLDGTWRIWDETGLLRQESHFVNGEPDGLQSHWDARGQLVAQGTVTNGLREGTFLIDVVNADGTATKEVVAEFRAGKLLTDFAPDPGPASPVPPPLASDTSRQPRGWSVELRR